MNLDPVVQQAIQQTLQSALQHHRAGRLKEAEGLYRQILQYDPQEADALHLLGLLAHQLKRHALAVELIRKAIATNPNIGEAHCNLGNALAALGDYDAAIASHRQAIVLKPDYAEAHFYLGVALSFKGQLDETIAAYRAAIAARPDYPEAHNNLGDALKSVGRLDEALAAYRQAIALRPTFVEVHSNLVNSLHFHPGYDARHMLEELRGWNAVHAAPLKKTIKPHVNDRTPERRLKIGYLSADFKAHASAFFLDPLLRAHDRTQVEIYGYGDVAAPDALTKQFQSICQVWRNSAALSDDALARQIRSDGIDILVDLKLHTEHNRLLVFARKPAPVQATWLGYPGTTGLETIDYRLSDPYLDPPGNDESVYSEQTLRLPESFWCFDPLDCRDIPVNTLPALEKGIVTFGCLNNFCKVNEECLVLWSQVLRQVEGSRLVLLAPEGQHRNQAVERMGREGIDPERVEFISNRPRRDYMSAYHRIDITLDSFPCNGHTTSLDSFWMGVPVVTRVGQTVVGRAAWSQLSNLGLPELAGHTADEFVRIAVALARDLPRLRELRDTLRQRMEHSPLMDGPRFARNMEAAYRQMWRKWCAPAG